MEKVYLIIEEWSVDGNNGMNHYIYKDKDDAQKSFNTLKVDALHDTKNNNYEVFHDTDNYFESELEGYYNLDHITLTLKEMEVK